jgi:F-type H+-transporting ATPase subunit epsilon
MAEIELQIVTTEKNIYTGTVDYIGVQSTEGRLGILPNHVSLITELSEGNVTYKESGNTKEIDITGGFMEVFKNSVTILADSVKI